MKTEYEIRVLEIEKESIVKKLESLGAIQKGEYNQKRYVYDLKPIQKDKWIRLRTNGIETTLTYKDIDLDDINVILEPAPYIADKVDMHKEKDWNEFLRLIGIANTNFQKKERNIKDEVLASQGGTVASRYSRFDPRQTAIELINEKFSDVLEKPIEVSYYDGIPTTEKEENIESSEDGEYDDISI